MNPPQQAAFLYYGVWTAETDTILLDTIIGLKKDTRWTECHFPSWFLMTAEQELQAKAGVVVSEEEIAKRIDVLHKRYRIFKDMVVKFGAQWDMPTKSVYASDELWEKIMKYNWFAGAYYYKDEPKYSRLACLFGMTAVKVESEKEVIVLSDNTEKLLTEEPSLYEIGEVNDEVNSPCVFPPPAVRRKLFPDAPAPTDRESTTDVGIYFIDLAPDGQLRTRFEKGRALPPPHNFKPNALGSKVGECGPSTRSPHESSCGSNSPIGWWPNLPK